MTEQELRTLVRQVIARSGAVGRVQSGPEGFVGRVLLDPPDHTSHMMFVLPDGADADGPCIIEPSVMCTHCGYCRSMGH